jgi:hypothetical protein
VVAGHWLQFLVEDMMVMVMLVFSLCFMTGVD